MSFNSANFSLYVANNGYPINQFPLNLSYTLNYFNDSSINGKIREGDWIVVKASDGVEVVWIAGAEVPSIGGNTSVSVLTQSTDGTNISIWDDNGNIF